MLSYPQHPRMPRTIGGTGYFVVAAFVTLLTTAPWLEDITRLVAKGRPAQTPERLSHMLQHLLHRNAPRKRLAARQRRSNDTRQIVVLEPGEKARLLRPR
jgi:hypothetical protein